MRKVLVELFVFGNIYDMLRSDESVVPPNHLKRGFEIGRFAVLDVDVLNYFLLDLNFSMNFPVICYA
jgi:hypothetical protein